jgi:hypothetical protein
MQAAAEMFTDVYSRCIITVMLLQLALSAPACKVQAGRSAILNCCYPQTGCGMSRSAASEVGSTANLALDVGYG